MLSESEVERLVTHISSIFNEIILLDITPDGFILAADREGDVYPDTVTTHHLVELCTELNQSITSKLIQNAKTWFSENHNSFSNPFFVSTMLTIEAIEPKQISELSNSIISNQRMSGFIDLYSGFLDGGNIFSTLWAIKILRLADCEKNRESIQKSFLAIDQNWGDIHRTSFKGFYLEQLILFGDDSGLNHSIASVINEIVNDQNIDGIWDNSHFYTPYVLGNLCITKGHSLQQEVICKALRKMFDLEKEEVELPKFISEAKESYEDSPFIQICMRSLISAIRYLRVYHKLEATEAIARKMFGLFPQVYQMTRAIESDRKKMIRQYGEIRGQFEHLEKFAEESISNEYEKNVFIMMPFIDEKDNKYDVIAEVLRNELDKHGYTAWLATDRNIRPQLWDNVVCFMLKCKYGIAIFTKIEKDDLRKEIDEFNPNVSLELGFFLSRGKQVLILKDKDLPKLQTDLLGHLYDDFDFTLMKEQLPTIIQSWVQEISSKKKENTS